MNILELTAAQLRRAAELKEQLEAAHTALASILDGGLAGNGGFTSAAPAVAPRKKLHWTQTPEGKARMDKIRRMRWRKHRA
jgi:hypothetical protein